MLKIKIFLITVLGVAMMGLLTGCSFGMRTSYVYANGDQYVAGDREISEKIDTLDIDYVSGDVMLETSSSDKIVIRETSLKELDDKRKVHTWVEGSVLHVRYCASARKLDLNRLGKKLTIELPSDMELGDIDLKVASGDVKANCGAGNINVHSASGNISFVQKGNSSDIELSTASGDVDFKAENADKITVSAASGNIDIYALDAKEVESATSSGETNVSFARVPKTSNISGTSGDITIYLPENPDVTASFKATTGDITYKQAFTKSEGIYVCGNGSNEMNAHTVSGDISIEVISD